MRAIRLTGWEQPAQLVEVADPEPGPGEVLLRVAGAGRCHSDLHLMHWPAGTLPYELPFTLGHEVAGTVAGLGLDGGLAEHMVVPSPRLTVPLDGLDPVAAAPLADAGLTPYHAIRRVLPLLRPGTTAIVIGVGGLGHVAVQLVKALSPARVVAVDRREQALEVAARSGADAVLPASDLTPSQLRAAAGGRGAAVVVDCVGSDDTLALAAGAVTPGGQVSVLGLAGGTFPMRAGAVPLETSVIFSNWGTREELAEVIELARAGAIAVETERVPLAAVPAAYERLADGGCNGRLVAVPEAA
jgi:alcohol dehydrogenase, propanol-preferring